MKSNKKPLRPGIRTAWAASVIAHAVVLTVLLAYSTHRAPKAPAQRTPQHVVLLAPHMRAPVPAAPSVVNTPPLVEAPPPRPKTRRAKRSPLPVPATQTAQLPGIDAPAIADPNQAAAPSPRRLDLFGAANHLPEAAPPAARAPVSQSATDRAEAMLHGLRRDLRHQRAADKLPPAMQALGSALDTHFYPNIASLTRHVRSGSVAETFKPWLEGHMGTDGAALAQANQVNVQHDRGIALGGGVCFGACADSDHAVAQLRVTVDVVHDGEGVPRTWRVLASSQDRQFDEDAVQAVVDAVGVWKPGDGTDLRQVERSRWVFDAQVLRWGRAELLLDPGFTPPGREIDSSLGGTSTLVHTVRLVAMQARETTP